MSRNSAYRLVLLELLILFILSTLFQDQRSTAFNTFMKWLITVWEEVTYSNKCKLSAEVPKMQMHLEHVIRECEQGPPSSSYCPRGVPFYAVTPRHS